jgi:type VI secretion system protein ImpK
MALTPPDTVASPAAPARGGTPLLATANSLLDTAIQIRIGGPIELDALRAYLVSEMHAFQERATLMGIPVETIIGARYCLCTALDEAIALTQWGGDGRWSTHSLLVTFHSETWGGEKFFQLLARLCQNPAAHLDLIELQYYCLQLGFEGRYRVLDQGQSQLDGIRQRLLRILRVQRGEYAALLSQHALPDKRIATGRRGRVPVWVWLIGAVLATAGMYTAFRSSADSRGDVVAAAIRNARLPDMAAQGAKTETAASLLQGLCRLGLIEVKDLADRSIVTIHGDGLFASGSANEKDAYRPVLASIAGALNQLPGDIIVNGYTDDQPIHTQEFPSNDALSLARARRVEQMLLVNGLSASRHITAAGLGESNPIASNDAASGRARNRRVEIVLMRSAATPVGDAQNGSMQNGDKQNGNTQGAAQ